MITFSVGTALPPLTEEEHIPMTIQQPLLCTLKTGYDVVGIIEKERNIVHNQGCRVNVSPCMQ